VLVTAAPKLTLPVLAFIEAHPSHAPASRCLHLKCETRSLIARFSSSATPHLPANSRDGSGRVSPTSLCCPETVGNVRCPEQRATSGERQRRTRSMRSAGALTSSRKEVWTSLGETDKQSREWSRPDDSGLSADPTKRGHGEQGMGV